MSLLLVSLLLGKLSLAEYAYWIVFTTLGGFGLQLQGAIQNVVVREIAREHHGLGVGASLARARIAYRRLTWFMAGPLFLGGAVYLVLMDATIALLLAWSVFIAAFVVVYWFAPNNALLLGTDRLGLNSNINTISRVLYVAAAWLLLRFELQLLGLCVAFALASLVSTGLNRFAVAGFHLVPPDPAFQPSSIGHYALFSLASFALYNGAVLFGFLIAPKGVMAGYGLAIQIATMILAVATVPAQAWLGRLSRALNKGDVAQARRQVMRSAIVGNLLFIIGFAAFVLLGAPLLGLLGTSVAIPGAGQLGVIFGAFLVELNILLLCFFLVSMQQFGFVRTYLCTATVGLALGLVAASALQDLFWLAALPLVVQLLVCLPTILFTASKEFANVGINR